MSGVIEGRAETHSFILFLNKINNYFKKIATVRTKSIYYVFKPDYIAYTSAFVSDIESTEAELDFSASFTKKSEPYKDFFDTVARNIVWDTLIYYEEVSKVEAKIDPVNKITYSDTEVAFYRSSGSVIRFIKDEDKLTSLIEDAIHLTYHIDKDCGEYSLTQDTIKTISELKSQTDLVRFDFDLSTDLTLNNVVTLTGMDVYDQNIFMLQDKFPERKFLSLTLPNKKLIDVDYSDTVKGIKTGEFKFKVESLAYNSETFLVSIFTSKSAKKYIMKQTFIII